jgi:amino acid adenylation domain-containing protein
MADLVSLVAQFERQAQSTPHAVALDDDGQLTTYAQLDQWSDTVCADLMAAGAVPGGLIGILLPRDSRWIPAILGVLKAGCGYVPLDPLYPEERLALMVEDSGLKLILGDPAGADLPSSPLRVDMPGAQARRRSASRPPLGPDSPAYVIYTSGSSGRPKGVPIRHRNVLGLFQAVNARVRYEATDVWSLFHSPSFDFSVYEMWGPLLTGARIATVPQHARVDPAVFVEFLRARRVSVLCMVPTVFRHLVASGAGPQGELAVRQVVFGGEAVDPVAVSEWLSTLPARRRPVVLNMYGITESTVHVTLREMTEADFTRTEPGTLIGTALAHARMRLVDSRMRPVEKGEIGEILLDGVGVTDGYLGRPDLNRERFVELTSADGSVARCFRTGDTARWDEETGSYVYHGRIDDQVKVNGHRIELGEVEAGLRACPGVFEAAVVLHSPPGRAPSLLAHVVAAPPAAGLAEHSPEPGDPKASARAIREIRRALATKLPRYMIPQHIELVSSLPRTASGKVSRRGLVPGTPAAD